VAIIIRKHQYSDLLYDKPVAWEEKILNYADKRVAHSDIVSLDEREKEGNARWIKINPRINDNKEESDQIRKINQELEKEIFNIIGLNPEKLKSYMEEEKQGQENI